MALETLGLISGWILLVLKIAYDRMERVFLFVNKVKYFLLNTATFWDLDIEYKGRFDKSFLEKVKDIVQQNFDNKKVIREASRALTVLADGININVELSGEVETVSNDVLYYQDVDITLKDIRSSFREAKNIVNRMVSVLGSIDKEVGFEDSKYCATIKFKKYNPYFGLYVKRLKLKEIDSFTCLFNIEQSKSESNKVLIAKDSISITTKRIASFQSLSLKYLCLS
jgi:hypothetical protein